MDAQGTFWALKTPGETVRQTDHYSLGRKTQELAQTASEVPVRNMRKPGLVLCGHPVIRDDCLGPFRLLQQIPQTGALQTKETYFSQLQRLRSPRTGHWQVQGLP